MTDLLNTLQRLILMAPTFLIAIILHEASHAWVADRLGDPTGRWAGRISLDPKVHFDPLGGLLFLVSAFSGIGFGWAKPVPVNPYNFRNRRRDMMLVSLAGPAANLVQLACWAGIFHLLVLPLIQVRATWANLLLMLISFGVLENAVLFCFNLLPIPPLDGSRVLAWILPERDAQTLDRLEPYGFVIVLAFLLMFGQYLSPMISWLVGLFGLR